MTTPLRLPPVADVAPIGRPERQKIQRWYDQAVQFANQDDAESHSQAHRRLVACLERDPCNSLYVALVLRNLRQWQRPARRPGWLGRKYWQRKVRSAAGHGTAPASCSAWQSLCIQALEKWKGLVRQEVTQQWALCAATCEQLPAALILLQELPEQERDPETWSLAAQALTRLGRFEDATTAWRRALAMEPTHPLAQAAVGGAESKAMLPSTAEHSPEDAQRMMELAREYAEQGQWTTAQQCLQAAMSANPGRQDLLMAWEDLQLKHVAAQQAEAANLPSAEHLIEELQALKNRLELEIFDARATRRPGEPEWRFAAARILMKQGRADAAIKQLEPMPEMDSAQPLAFAFHALFAEALQMQRRFEDALAQYTLVMQQFRDDREEAIRAAEQGARLAAAMGRMDLAESWRRLLKHADPTSGGSAD